MDSAASARPDDDEARRRRSTDCIYFLASPLTCKKGSECEYRHSDAARMNPRDCWYWFNGNCTNPKCSFRHPPLDNLLGAPATPRAAQQSAQQVPVPAQAHGSSTIPSGGPGTAKQGVPCYYFQQGMCAKGVKCAFLHVPQAAGNSAPQKVLTSALQPNPQSKNSWTNKPDSSVQQNTASGILDKSKVSTHDVKPTQKQNLTTRIDHSSRIYQKDSSSHAQSGSARHYHQPQHSVKDDIAEHGVEVGEFVREPLAGSGILAGRIDYESEQSFKGNHNSYRRTSGEQHTGMRRTHGSHEPERLYRGSSGETLLSDKRISQREPMNVTASSSDLRHRLLKQRRLSNPISTQAPDRHDAYLEGCQHRRGNEQAAHDGLTRSRLHGRIKLPGEETSFDRLDSRSEREKDRGSRARLSPPKHTDLRGKLHERLKSRSNEDILDNAKSSVKKAIIGEDAGSLNFTGPKSLAELKAKKVLGSSGEDAISSTASFVGLPHRTSETVASRDSSESVPFEGPKPLSVILKRKRQATSADSGSRQEEEEEEEEEEEDPARVEGESRKLQIPESDPVEVNMEANGEEDEDAFHPEDDMAYDDNFDGKDLEEPQDEEYDYDTADINAVEDAGELEEPQDEGYDYDVADVNAGNAVEDAGKELEEPQDEDYEYDAADINAGNAVEDAGKELEEPQDEDYDYDAAGINAGDAAEDAGKELEEPQDEDYDYDAADINASNAAEDAGKELEEPQDEDYDYDAADINADEDNDYQEYEDDDDLEDNDDFARKVGVMIS